MQGGSLEALSLQKVDTLTSVVQRGFKERSYERPLPEHLEYHWSRSLKVESTEQDGEMCKAASYVDLGGASRVPAWSLNRSLSAELEQ